MRKRYFTSHKKLSIIILCFIFSSVFAKQKNKETNIVCFAAKTKWVCAPENQQSIASGKAKLLLEKKTDRLLSPEVEINTIKFPKFSKKPEPRRTQQLSNKFIDFTTEKKDKIKIQTTETHVNPYAKLWSHQLVGLSTPQAAINFVKEKQLSQSKVLIIKSSRENMDWWIVLYELYDGKQGGIDNEINLPNTINKPWLRPLKNLIFIEILENY